MIWCKSLQWIPYPCLAIPPCDIDETFLIYITSMFKDCEGESMVTMMVTYGDGKYDDGDADDDGNDDGDGRWWWQWWKPFSKNAAAPAAAAAAADDDDDDDDDDDADDTFGRTYSSLRNH